MDIHQFRVLLPNYTIDKDEFLDGFHIGIHGNSKYYELKTIENNINEIIGVLNLLIKFIPLKFRDLIFKVYLKNCIKQLRMMILFQKLLINPHQ